MKNATKQLSSESALINVNSISTLTLNRVTKNNLTESNLYKFSKKQTFIRHSFYLLIKRIVDIFASFFALLLLSPLFFIISFFIKMNDGGPAIHTRLCTGKGGRTYKMYKFRTMVMDADNLERWLSPEQMEIYLNECKLDDDPRITKLGKWLRKTSVDELPQLFSVLKGDMSLVGPRPIVEFEKDFYSSKQIETIFRTKPGITGYWQVNGRSDTTYESGKRQQMELYYCENCSLLLDIKILFKTVAVVLKKEGAR